MKKTIVVPIDFTPVSHEALLYACEVSVGHEMDIVAVHILDTKYITQFNTDESSDVREAAEKMYQEVIQKTQHDLDNFLDGLDVFYGNIVHPLIAHGTIYEAFNDVAAKYNSPLIIMGTHGIVGMQHIFGSKAYKVIQNSPYPFLVVQARSYNPIKKVYFAFEKHTQLNDYIDEIITIANLYDGEMYFNTYSPTETGDVDMPEKLMPYAGRIKFARELFGEENIVERAKNHGADAIAMIIDEKDNISDASFGLTQDKILVNNYKLPVFSLPLKK